MTSAQDIPEHLERPAQAAVAWLNETRSSRFELTGVIESASPDDSDPTMVDLAVSRNKNIGRGDVPVDEPKVFAIRAPFVVGVGQGG